MQLNFSVLKVAPIVLVGCFLSGCNSTYYYSNKPASIGSNSPIKLSTLKKTDQVKVGSVTYRLSNTYFAASGERCGSGQGVSPSKSSTPVILCANPQTGVWRVIPSVLTKFGT